MTNVRNLRPVAKPQPEPPDVFDQDRHAERTVRLDVEDWRVIIAAADLAAELAPYLPASLRARLAYLTERVSLQTQPHSDDCPPHGIVRPDNAS